MKRTLLLMIGLSLLTMEGIAQKGQGRGRGQEMGRGHNKQTTINRQPEYQQRNGHDRQRDVYISQRKRSGRNVMAHRGNQTVIVHRNPGIRYTRPVVIRPNVVVRPYVRYERRDFRHFILSTGQVNAIAQSMSYAQFDDDALQIAKNRIRRNSIRSEDVAYLMSQLHFEDHKLELAKYAWSRTVDRRNFNIVFNELKFRSSQNELDRFIGRY